jgi:acyl-CoA thioester hydrolase
MDLSIETTLQIRFSDTDAMGVVWHGNYLRFFEDGREAFGEKYGLEYLDVYNSGYFTPIVKTDINYKNSIYYGDQVKMITRFVNNRSAKIVFEYELINIDSGLIIASGSTTQVFLSVKERELRLDNPDFYLKWKQGLLGIDS